MTVPRDRRELEEYMQARFLEILPRALERLEEMAASPNKRAAEDARRLLARYDAHVRTRKEQEGARTRAAS